MRALEGRESLCGSHGVAAESLRHGYGCGGIGEVVGTGIGR